MRIDAYTHFMPSRMFKLLVDSGYPDIGKRMREVPCIHDLDIRKKVVDTFKDYAQILSYPMPPLEAFTKGDGVKANDLRTVRFPMQQRCSEQRSTGDDANLNEARNKCSIRFISSIK